MAERISVVLADNELSERERLRKQLANEKIIHVIGEARDGKECVDLVLRQHPDIVLIKEDLPVLSGLAAAERIAAEAPGVGVILILTGAENEAVFRKMLRAGIRDFLTRPIPDGRLAEEIRKVVALQSKDAKKAAAAASSAAPESPLHRVITVTGPRGGCGKTVLATNLAVVMARGSEKIAMVDLNLWGGDVAMLLDMTPRRTLGDLLPGFGGIDFDVVEATVAKHATGLSVLAAPMTGTFDGATLSRYMVQSILEAMRDHYDCTLVDTGYANLESTLAAMDNSDIIVVVVGMDLPRLRDGKLYLKNLVAANYPKEKIRVVVNRTGSSKEISASEVESILDFPVTAQIPGDDMLVGSSVNLGQPFVITSPGRPLSKALIAFAENLVPAIAGKNKSGARWFSFLH
jgi:pilus assembly protein CpaE